MELTYNELKKKDVINVSDGSCLGRIKDLRLDFPEGILVGIYVPGRRDQGIFKIFNHSELYIDESKIIKIGGDVILVDLKCGETCAPSVRRQCPPPNKKSPPPCPPPCSNNCQPHKNQNQPDFGILSGGVSVDVEDY